VYIFAKDFALGPLCLKWRRTTTTTTGEQVTTPRLILKYLL
jgi:hypothetical protein